MHYNHIKRIQTMTLRGQEGGFKSSSKFIIMNRISTPTSYGHKRYSSVNVDTSWSDKIQKETTRDKKSVKNEGILV